MAGDQKSLLKVLFILHPSNITFSGCWDDYKSFKSVLNLAVTLWSLVYGVEVYLDEEIPQFQSCKPFCDTSIPLLVPY